MAVSDLTLPREGVSVRIALANLFFSLVMGWGAGRHPCNGIRWAKIQQTMMLAYALAMYKWTGCFPDGSPNPEFIPPTTALKELAPALPQNLYCKAVPREKA